MSEWEKRLEKPSVPLLAKGPPGPPKIVEIEKKYSAIEGTLTKEASIGFPNLQGYVFDTFRPLTFFFQNCTLPVQLHSSFCLFKVNIF